MIVGLFAPEFIRWVAFEQYRKAKDLCVRMKKKLGEERLERRCWSMN